VFENLNIYEPTTHFNGQSTVVLDGDRAMGESYCIAYHISSAPGGTDADDRGASLPRHVHQGRRDVAVRRAPALRGLDGDARAPSAGWRRHDQELDALDRSAGTQSALERKWW
jgi:hypothetical protein